MLKSLFHQTSWYFAGHIIGTAIGFFSFPLWTRYFTVKEYGMLSLIGVTMAFVGPLTKMGLNRSVVRFYSEFTTGKRELSLVSFHTTLYFGALLFSAGFALIFWVVIKLLGPELLGGEQMYNLYILNSYLIFLGAGPAIFFSFLRVEERAKFMICLQTSTTIVQFGLAVLLVMVFVAGIKGLYLGAIFMQVATVCLVTALLLREKKLVLTSFSVVFLVDAIRFGFPLVPAALANEISAIGDRYVIQFFMGAEAVGLYSVAYGLTGHLKSLLTVMMFALTPMYVKIFEEQGRAKTESFLASIFDFYLMLAVPAIVLFSWFGGDLMVLLASSKYQGARGIVPFLTMPLVLHGAITIYTAGLFINKKTYIVLICTASAGALNIILNIAMVPQFGLVGAAIATLISYVFLIAMVNYFSAKYLTIRIDLTAIAKYLITSFIVVFLLQSFEWDIFAGVVIKMLLGALFYSAIILVIDSRKRQTVKHALHL